MRVILSNASPDPIYQQIVDQVKAMILSGELQPGEALPSIRALARDLQISVITTSRAYEELEKEGFLESVPGKGSFVAGQNREMLREMRMRLLEEKIQHVLSESKVLGISTNEVIEMIRLLSEEGN